MITIKSFLNTTRSILTDPKALGILAILYALLLATLYGFISIREATFGQVALTFFFLVLIPIEFFVLQAATLNHARAPKFQWGQILRDAIKIAVVTIPIILLGFLIQYLLNKWQMRHPAPLPPPVTFSPREAAPAPQPLHWPTMLFATARLLLLGVALPLAAIHLWIEATYRDGGARTFIQRVGNALSRAFALDSVLTYALGLIIFFLVPYFILFSGKPPKGNKTDFAVFILRLLLVFLFTLIGWVVTLTTLTKIEPSPAVPLNITAEVPAEAPA
jgi:hypothetical protein